MEPGYGKRLWTAASKDFRQFWSSHRLWVTIASLLSPSLIQVFHHGWSSLFSLRNILESAALGLVLAIIGNCVIALWRGVKSLDTDWQERLSERDTLIANHERTIQQQTQTIHSLSTRPKHSAADQHHYDTIKACLQTLGKPAIGALRYLRNHGTLTFNFAGCTTSLPADLTRETALWVYNHCVSEGVVTCKPNLGNTEQTYAVSSTMEKILDEVLYEDNGLSGLTDIRRA